jgi:hypothetical protein
MHVPSLHDSDSEWSLAGLGSDSCAVLGSKEAEEEGKNPRSILMQQQSSL